MNIKRLLISAGCWAFAVACATGVTHVKIDEPLSTSATTSSSFSGESVPISVGKITDSRPDISSLGVKKNAYGMPMGKVDVDDNVIFIDLVKGHLINCLRTAGFSIQDKDQAKLLFEADIKTFWVEFMPGLIVVDALSNVIIEARVKDIQTRNELWSETFRGKAKVSGMAVTAGMFQSSINTAYKEAMTKLYESIADENIRRKLIEAVSRTN